MLSLANISWASFESGFNGGPLALTSVSPSCIFLRGYVLIIPLQGKEYLWRAYVLFYQTRTVCNSRLTQQHCSENSSIAIISSTVAGNFLFCSSTRPNFLLSFCEDLSATLCLLNIAKKQYPIVAVIYWKFCCVVFLCLLNILNCLLNSTSISCCNG